MSINEKKALYIDGPGPNKNNVLPSTASFTGYDLNTQNFIYYDVSTDAWNQASSASNPQEYWQSDINNQIFTTGSIVVSGSVILGDAASDVVYISGSVTASNGLLVNGNLKVNGGVVTYGGTTVDGGTIVGQQFEDTDTSGNSYGLVIKNSGTNNGVPFLSFVQGATVASGFAGGIGGWTKAPSSGYIPGLNLSFYSSYPRIGIRNASASTNIATFDANGLQVTGSVNVSNGVKVAAGGLQVAGIVPGISSPYNNSPMIIDLVSGQTYGPVIRSAAGQYNFAALSLDQNGTYLGGIYGIENDPGGFGYVDGVNISSNGASRKINFNVNQVSVGKFSSTGLQVTGSIYTQMLKVNGSITDGTITIPGAGSGFSLRGSAFLDDTDASGNSYGTVIRSQAGNLAYASLSFIQDNTYAGSLSALNNTPAGTTYGYRGGLNISAAEGKIINFRIAYPSILSVGNFNANGLEVTGSVAATLGFSGSLTRLTDGTSYIIAGSGISVSSASNGAITVAATGGVSDIYWQSDINNQIFTTGSIVVSGSVILGDSASDIITITGQLTASNGLRAAGVSTFAANTSFTGSVGYFGINIDNTADATLILSGTDTRGGAGYYNFLYVSNSYSASVNRVKNFRVASDGNFEIISSDYSTNIFALSDTGTLTIPGGYLASKASSFFGVKEKFNTKSGATGTVVHDCSTGHIFYHSGATANWTSNFTNLSMSNGYATTITLVVTQSSNAYIPSAIQLDGVGQTLNWQGNVTPTGTASRRDVISFSILNVSSSYIVLGQFVSF